MPKYLKPIVIDFERVDWLQARIDHVFAVSLHVQALSHSNLNPTEAYSCGFAGFSVLERFFRIIRNRKNEEDSSQC